MLGHWLDISNQKELIDVGLIGNDFDYRILRENGSEVNLNNYEITENFGTLEVTKRPITISTESKTWVYNDEYFSHKEYKVTPNGEGVGLVLGHWLDISNQKGLIDVGLIDNDFDYRILRANGSEVNLNNYEITEDFGTLEVTKRPITISTESMTWVYNDEYFSHRKYEVTPNGEGVGLVLGHRLLMIGWRQIREVGSSPNDSEYRIYRSVDGSSVNLKNYEITEDFGTLEVTKRPITISTESKTWVYNDEYFSHHVYSFTPWAEGVGLVEGHTLDLENWNSIINVEIKPNDFDYRILRANGSAVNLGNYEITAEFGTLEVTPRKIKLQSVSKTWPYDGKAHDAPDFGLVEGETVAGHLIAIAQKTTVTAVGKYPNELKEIIYNASFTDVTQNYEVAWEYGTLEITGDAPEDEINVGEPDGSLSDLGENSEDEIVLYEVFSDYTGTVYLKTKSFGFYNLSSDLTWSNAPEYGELIYSTYPASYLTSLILENHGETPYSVEITPKGNVNVILPYFAYDGNYSIPLKEYYGSTSSPYQVNFFPRLSVQAQSLSGELGEYEERYAKFVKQIYLQIDQQTRALMDQIIAENGFDKNDPEIIAKVASYIQNAAKYNLDYDKAMDKEQNQVVAFLTIYKEGVCRHYASAATLLFRALGIPARYTVGFLANTKAGETVEIGSVGHAWTEVYIEGLGWIPVEVTGSSDEGNNPGGNNPGGDNPGGDNPGDDNPDDPETDKEKLEIYPVSKQQMHDMCPLYADNEIVQTAEIKKLLEKGYSYEVVVSGVQIGFGTSPCKIESFILYDPNGEDVTNRFEIDKKTGSLQVMRQFIKIYIGEKQKFYDGTPLSYGSRADLDYFVMETPEGFVISDIEINISMTDSGQLLSDIIEANIRDYVSYRVTYQGADVTEYIGITIVDMDGSEDSYVVCSVDPRPITVTTGSASKQYDETPLTCNQWYISENSLVNGHQMTVFIDGSITEEGIADNTARAYMITDKAGNDMSDNYVVKVVAGTLTVYK